MWQPDQRAKLPHPGGQWLLFIEWVTEAYSATDRLMSAINLRH